MNDENEGKVIAGSCQTMRTLADGTLRLQIDIEPRDRQAGMLMFGEPGSPVALARLRMAEDGPGGDQGALTQSEPAPPSSAPYGEYARQLHASGFFRVPAVWRASGTDDEFLLWLREQRCTARSSRCEGQIVPAHYRMTDENSDGGGVGIKPEYHAIPLCHGHHSLQHQKGYAAVMPPEEWRKAVVRCLVNWCRDEIKERIGYEHFNEMPPAELVAWAETMGVEQYLPRSYRDAT